MSNPYGSNPYQYGNPYPPTYNQQQQPQQPPPLGGQSPGFPPSSPQFPPQAHAYTGAYQQQPNAPYPSGMPTSSAPPSYQQQQQQQQQLGGSAPPFPPSAPHMPPQQAPSYPGAPQQQPPQQPPSAAYSSAMPPSSDPPPYPQQPMGMPPGPGYSPSAPQFPPQANAYPGAPQQQPPQQQPQQEQSQRQQQQPPQQQQQQQQPQPPHQPGAQFPPQYPSTAPGANSPYPPLGGGGGYPVPVYDPSAAFPPQPGQQPYSASPYPVDGASGQMPVMPPPYPGFAPVPTPVSGPPDPNARQTGQQGQPQGQVFGQYQYSPSDERLPGSGQLHPQGYPTAEKRERQGGPRKKALVVGCNYCNTDVELKGCINDAQYMKYMLIKNFGFKEDDIKMMTDEPGSKLVPTKSNIMAGFQWLIKGVQPNDRLFFHFSGHGSQKRDYSGEEKDGFNETLLPTDFRTTGQIVDDDVNERLVNPLPRGVVLHAVIDACHSGTAMDLQFYTKCKNGQFYWKDNYERQMLVRNKSTSGGIAIQFGACKDSQVAQDTAELSGSTNSGAATYSFIEAVELGGLQQSYSQVLCHMQRSLDKLAKMTGNQPGGGMLASIVGRVMQVGKQTPQLSCNERIDLNTPLML